MVSLFFFFKTAFNLHLLFPQLYRARSSPVVFRRKDGNRTKSAEQVIHLNVYCIGNTIVTVIMIGVIQWTLCC